MALWGWSKTAATNATADPSINWSEGQLPSTVNDSARGMMAAVAKYRDDISGAIVTTGTSTAYAIASNSSFGTLANLDGQVVAFTPAATNTGAVTLAVDGLAAKPIRGAPGVDLPSGSLIIGTPYVVTYNNADGVFYLQGGLSSPYAVPLGGMIDYTGVTAPNSAFIFPIGQTLSRTTYPSLWTFAQAQIAASNPLYSNGDGSTTFGVPDLRGRVSVAPDASASRFSSVTSGAVGGNSNAAVSIAQNQLPNVALSVTAGGTATVTSSSGVLGSLTAQAFSFGTIPFLVGVSVNVTSTGTASVTGGTSSINGGVTQSSLSIAMPWIGLNKILRVF